MLRKIVKATAVTLTIISTIGVAKPTQVDAATTYVQATSNVNVRTGSSTKYKSLGKLKKGTKVKLISTSGSWYRIQYTSKTKGWVKKTYAKKVSSSSSSLSVKKTITVKAYAYTGGGYTATGTKAKYGTLAVDPKVIPYGTKIYIKELNKVFTAEDCGGGIKGNKIDIYMNSKSACNSWGVRTITLQILK